MIDYLFPLHSGFRARRLLGAGLPLLGTRMLLPVGRCLRFDARCGLRALVPAWAHAVTDDTSAGERRMEFFKPIPAMSALHPKYEVGYRVHVVRTTGVECVSDDQGVVSTVVYQD